MKDQKSSSIYKAVGVGIFTGVIANLVYDSLTQNILSQVVFFVSITITIISIVVALVSSFLINKNSLKKVIQYIRMGKGATLAGLTYFRPVRINLTDEETDVDEICEKIAHHIRIAPPRTQIEILIASGYRTLHDPYNSTQNMPNGNIKTPIKDALLNAQTNNITVYMMCSDTRTALFKERCLASGKTPEQFLIDINSSKKFLKTLQAQNRLKVHTYFTSPIWRLFRIGNYMYVQYYCANQPSFKSIVYGFEATDIESGRPSSLFHPFENYIKEVIHKNRCLRYTPRKPSEQMEVTLHGSSGQLDGHVLDENIDRNGGRGFRVVLSNGSSPYLLDMSNMRISIQGININNSSCTIKWVDTKNSQVTLGTCLP